MSEWRAAGLSYVNYSNIAARVLRSSLKKEQRDDALKRGEANIKFFYWADGEILPEGHKPKAREDKEDKSF